MSLDTSEESLHLFLSDDDNEQIYEKEDSLDLHLVFAESKDHLVKEDPRVSSSNADTLTSGLGSDLLADETLNRNSPDHWPDTLPGVGEFVSLYSPASPSPPPSRPPTPLVDTQFFPLHDLELLTELSQLRLDRLLREIKILHNIAFDLGLQEAKEMTRGRYLNILRKHSNYD